MAYFDPTKDILDKVIVKDSKVLFFGHMQNKVPSLYFFGVVDRSHVKFRHVFMVTKLLKSFAAFLLAFLGLFLFHKFLPDFLNYYMIVFLPVVFVSVVMMVLSYNTKLPKFKEQFFNAPSFIDVDDVNHNRFWREHRWHSLKTLKTYDAFLENCVLLVESCEKLKKLDDSSNDSWVDSMENLAVETQLKWDIEKYTDALENFVKLSNTIVRF